VRVIGGYWLSREMGCEERERVARGWLSREMGGKAGR